LGRKNSTVLTALLAGVFTISYAFVPDLGFSIGLNFVASWFSGMVTVAANNLTLEQVPTFRGTMMSIDSAAVNLGSALGAAVGGAALLSSGYAGMGLILGTLGVAAALIYHLLTTDPCVRR
jgi:predicted MFS family arabinose efflux permease